MVSFTYTFKRDDGKTEVELECELASEGCGLGIYVTEYDFVENKGDDILTEAEFDRLSEEVSENEEAIELWEDRGSLYD